MKTLTPIKIISIITLTILIIGWIGYLGLGLTYNRVISKFPINIVDNSVYTRAVENGNSILGSTIDAFMESQVKPSDIGKDNYHCSHVLYGYSDKYAYTWVYCSGYITKSDGTLEQGSAFSIPTRLTFMLPSYKILGYDQPKDGSLYASSLQELFPEDFYEKAIKHPSNEVISQLEKEVFTKATAAINASTSTPGSSTATVTKNATTKKIKVYLFDMTKFNTPDNTDYLTPVERSTDRSDIARFAIEQIILGPTEQEKKLTLQPTFGKGASAEFASGSTCNGADFKVSIEKKLATVQFCRVTMLAGDMSGFIIAEQIATTLKQFDTVDKVTVLNNKGNCFSDLSGLDSRDCTY